MTCFECDALAAHHHHVVPRSRGGTRTVPLCETCHALAHGLGDATWTDHARLTQRALAEKKKKGERIGRVPYGFQLAEDGVRLERCESEQIVIAACQELSAKGWSLAAIGEEMESRGLTPREGRWHAVKIWRILRSAEGKS